MRGPGTGGGACSGTGQRKALRLRAEVGEKWLERLWEAGASVPRPLAAGSSAVIMGFVGDEQRPAPVLERVPGLDLVDRRVARARAAVVGVGHVAGGAAFAAVVAVEPESAVDRTPRFHRRAHDVALRRGGLRAAARMTKPSCLVVDIDDTRVR